MTNHTLTLLDFSNESAVVSFNGVALDAANFAAQIGLRDVLIEATLDLVLGVQTQVQTSIINRFVEEAPTNPVAQRENKFIIFYRDNSPNIPGAPGVENPGYGKYFNVEIPTANISLATLFKANSDELNMFGAGAAAQWTDWIADFQAFNRSPYGGLSLVVGGRYVGRRT